MALCSARASCAQTGVLSESSPPTSDMLLLTYTGAQPDLVQGLRGFKPSILQMYMKHGMSDVIHARIAERASDKDTWDCRRAFALARNQMQDRNRQAKHQDKLNHQLVHR